MSENQGMLFIFNYPSKQGFWMKEMMFPLDIIWLDSNYSVIHIEKKLQPCILFSSVRFTLLQVMQSMCLKRSLDLQIFIP